MSARVVLLLGLFAAPMLLLVLGHRLRQRSERTKRLFWGGVAGHIVGLCIATAAMMVPPIWWAGGSFTREAAVYGALLIGFLAGAAGGALRGRARPAAEHDDG